MLVFVFSVRRHLWQTIKIGQVPRVISYYIKMKDSLYLGIFSSIFLRIGTKWERLYLNTKILKFLWNIWKKALHKTCENTGFHWPIFSRIRTKSTIREIYRRIQVSETRFLAYFMQCETLSVGLIFWFWIFPTGFYLLFWHIR